MNIATSYAGKFPLGDQVLLKELPAEDKTEGGIHMPESAQTTTRRCEVLAVGSGIVESGVRVPLELEPGERVYVPSYGGVELTIGGEELLVMPISMVLLRYAPGR